MHIIYLLTAGATLILSATAAPTNAAMLKPGPKQSKSGVLEIGVFDTYNCQNHDMRFMGSHSKNGKVRPTECWTKTKEGIMAAYWKPPTDGKLDECTVKIFNNKKCEGERLGEWLVGGPDKLKCRLIEADLIGHSVRLDCPNLPQDEDGIIDGQDETNN